MTKAAYEALFVAARKDIATATLTAQLKVKLAYTRAASDVASALRATLAKEQSLITLRAQTQLLEQLAARSTALADDVSKVLEEAIKKSAKVASGPDSQFLSEALVGVYGKERSAEVVGAIYSRVNDSAVRNAVSRIYSDGYNLSARVWDLKGEFEETVKDILTTGIASGRDPVKLIKDIQVYVADGKLALANRWGSLERGSEEWKRRVKGKIDYRAQMLVRSEMQAMVQSLAVQSAAANPATTGRFEWVLGPGLAHCSVCVDYSVLTYTEDTVPAYPHPNCGCQVRPVLMSIDLFTGDLERWVAGEVDDENRYIDDWAQSYLFAA